MLRSTADDIEDGTLQTGAQSGGLLLAPGPRCGLGPDVLQLAQSRHHGLPDDSYHGHAL
jgi:hypothetical protein